MDRVTLLAPVTRRGLLKSGVALAGLAALGAGPARLLRFAGAQTSAAMALQLGWFANAQMAGEFTAIGKGYFKDAGIDVRIVPGGPSIDPVGVVASGSVPIGNVASIGVVMVGRSRGVPLKAFATAFQRHPFAFFFLRGKGIRTPADFAGKTIGIQATARPLLDAVLAKYQVPRDRVNVIIVGGTTTPLLTGQVDVITGWVINYAQNLPIQGRADHFLLWDLGIRQYAYTYFTTDQVYATRKDVLVRYIAAAARGWQYAKDHPEEAVDYTLRMASGLDREMELPTWKISIPYMSSVATKQHGWGYMDPQVWNTLSETYFSLEQMPRKVPAEEVMTNEIVFAAKTPRF
ncbi:MAG TPA: ABC transporter substrate-binding protein [bacterium]|nr:ABC transporter substrate-binding protein [bacterium]